MFPKYCNKCFRYIKYEPDLQLHLSKCSHVLCRDCLQSTCAVCCRPYKPMLIDKQMPAAMGEYFQDPIKVYRHFQKITKFHLEQEGQFVHHYFYRLPQQLKKQQRQSEAYMELDVRMKTDLEHEKERVKKLRVYLAYHEKRVEQPRYVAPSTPSTPSTPATPPHHYAPRSQSADILCTKKDGRAGARQTYCSDPKLARSPIELSQPRMRPQTPTLSLNSSTSSTTGDDEFINQQQARKRPTKNQQQPALRQQQPALRQQRFPFAGHKSAKVKFAK